MLFAFLILFFSLSVSQETTTTERERVQPKVAIIGGGIGGLATSQFLQKITKGQNLKIDLFEQRNRLCGRIHSETLEGKQVELGGSIFLSDNRYIRDFAAENGFNFTSGKGEGVPDTAFTGIWNEDDREFVFSTSGNKWWTLAKMLWRYGVKNMMETKNEVKKFLTQWDQIYTLQDQGRAFEKVEDFLNAVELYNLTQYSFEEFFRGGNLGELFVKELGYGVTKANYNQDIFALNALVGAISLSTIFATTLHVDGGNEQVCSAIVGDASVHLEHEVNLVREVSQRKYSLQVNGQPWPTLYDYVVVATPLEESAVMFEVPSAPKPHIPKRSYQQTFVTYVRGTIRPEFFGLESGAPAPSDVLLARTDKKPIFSSMGSPYYFEDGTALTKIFSEAHLPDEFLDQVFNPRLFTYRTDWKAYPKFTPPESFSPTVLYPNVFYLNSIETLGSAIEVSCVWARNIALLISNSLSQSKAPNSASLPKEEL